jgi:ABC-type Fe3+ transport system substrate-binding protein
VKPTSLLLAAALLVSACSSSPSDPLASTAPGQPSAPVAPAPETVEEVFAAIAALGLDDESTDSYLLERALTEGTVTFYLGSGAGTGDDLAEAWSQGFSEAFPGLKMEFVALSASDFNVRVLSEHRSGRPQVDVLRNASALLSELDAEGLLAAHSGILQSQGVPDWTLTRTGVINRMTPSVIPWNTERVPERAQPTDWDDFLSEEHAGCSLGPTPSWIVGMIADRGFDGTNEWFERFLSNGGQMTLDSGPALLRQMVSGEIDCVVHVSAVQAESARLSGAPIDWLIPDRSPASVFEFSVTSTTARPHAAALFARWVAGVEGSVIAASLGENPLNTNVAIISERLEPTRNPSSDDFQRLIIIGLDIASEFEPQAAEILARHHTPNVIRR